MAITIFAAYSDGDRCDEERARVDLIAAEFGDEDLSAISRRILMGKLSLAAANQVTDGAGTVKGQDRSPAL